jgi:hypothetical protein
MGFAASLEVCSDVAKGFCEQALLTSKVFINKTVYVTKYSSSYQN